MLTGKVLTATTGGDVGWETPSGGVDTSGTPVDDDFAKFTDGDTVEGRSYAEVKGDLDLEIGTDVQAWDAQLDDLADGTLTGDFVNTAYPWADNEVSNTLTASNLVSGSSVVADAEVDDDITLTNITQITNRASTSLSDTAAILYETELDSLAELDTQIGITGTPSSSNFWRGDNSWATPAGSGNVSTSGSPIANDFARFVGSTDIEGRSYAEARADLDLEAGTDFYSVSAADTAFEGELDNEARIVCGIK